MIEFSHFSSRKWRKSSATQPLSEIRGQKISGICVYLYKSGKSLQKLTFFGVVFPSKGDINLKYGSYGEGHFPLVAAHGTYVLPVCEHEYDGKQQQAGAKNLLAAQAAKLQVVAVVALQELYAGEGCCACGIAVEGGGEVVDEHRKCGTHDKQESAEHLYLVCQHFQEIFFSDKLFDLTI